MDRLIDIVVGSPERMIQHKDKGNLYFSKVTHVIIDEVDTMLTQGFGADIRSILRSVLGRNISNTPTSTFKDNGSNSDLQFEIEQPVLTSSHEPTSSSSRIIHTDNIITTSSSSSSGSVSVSRAPVTPPQLIMATATLTKAVKALLTDVTGAFNIEFNGE